MDLGQIYKDHIHLIKGIAINRGVPIDKVEDIAHDIIIRIAKYYHNYNSEKGSLKSWITVVSRNYIYEVQNKTKRYFPFYGMTAPTIPNAPLEKAERSKEIKGWMLKMPKRNMLVLYMFYWQGMDCKNIADHFGISVSFTRNLLFHSRDFLKLKLSDNVFEGKRDLSKTRKFKSWT